MEQALAFIDQYRYLGLFAIAAFEGPMISVIAGFLVFLGKFNPFIAYPILVVADVIPDIIYYYAGRAGGSSGIVERYTKSHPFVFQNLALIKKLWHRHTNKTMWVSKLAYGLSTPLLISAGVVKVPPRTFVRSAIPVTLTQHIVTMSIGFILGNSYYLAEQYLKFGGVTVAVLAAFFAVGYVALTKTMRREFEKMEREEEQR
jgi:membrane protein DedA with SNARE-associated domain